MFPGVNAKQMRQAMKQMGIQQEDLPASEVIIKLHDREIVISEPSVQKIKMQGQVSFQVAGEVSERGVDSAPEITDEDIKTVMEQTDCSEEDARKALEDSEGDLAQAILKISDN